MNECRDPVLTGLTLFLCLLQPQRTTTQEWHLLWAKTPKVCLPGGDFKGSPENGEGKPRLQVHASVWSPPSTSRQATVPSVRSGIIRALALGHNYSAEVQVNIYKACALALFLHISVGIRHTPALYMDPTQLPPSLPRRVLLLLFPFYSRSSETELLRIVQHVWVAQSQADGLQSTCHSMNKATD